MPRTTVPSLEKSTPASRERGRSYFLGVVSLLVGLLTLQALFNYTINPLVNFRSHRGLGRMGNQRQIKVDLLQAAQPRPEILILGSSRVRNLDPAQVGQAFGATAFNAGVQNGVPRDWLALARYAALDLKLPLRAVIVGVDPDSFLRDTIGMNHPAFITQLRRHLPHPWRQWFLTRQQLWDPSQTRKSWEILAWRFEGRTARDSISELGRIYQDLRDPPLLPKGMRPRADGFSPETVFQRPEKIRNSVIRAFAPKNSIQQEGIDYWNDLVDLAAQRNFALIVFIIPITPRLEADLNNAGSFYPRRLAETRKLLLDARDRGAIVCDIDPAALHFDDYPDLYHPGLQSSQAIIGQVHECARRAGAF